MAARGKKQRKSSTPKSVTSKHGLEIVEPDYSKPRMIVFMDLPTEEGPDPELEAENNPLRTPDPWEDDY